MSDFAPAVNQIAAGIFLGLLVSFLAWRLGSLSASGFWAASLSGSLIFGFGGLAWAILLLTFFVSSSLLSHTFKAHKSAFEEKFAKGSRRDWGQVFANGGLGMFLAVLHVLFPAASWIPWAFAGAMAAVNADTWATELGVLSQSSPRLITTGQQVEPGTSGAISTIGTFAALIGSALVAAVAVVLFRPAHPLTLWALVAAAGLLASLLDSWLGATVQAMYYCPTCLRETEKHPLHRCGSSTVFHRGWRWLNNDRVNLFCSLAGAFLAGLAWLIFH